MTDQAYLDDLKARVSLVDLIATEIKLQRKGREYVGLCPFHGEKTPSFTVNPAKGFYHCFGCGAHGDVIAWVMERRGKDFLEAVEDLASGAGLAKPTNDWKPDPEIEKQRRERLEKDERERAAKQEFAREIWVRGQAANGTLTHNYLKARGITLPPPVTLRFSSRCWHSRSAGELPAMIAAIQAANGRITGIHRTFLCSDGTAKTRHKPAKKMAGACWRGAVRLFPAAPVLAVAEGIETALSVAQRAQVPAWAALSLGNMESVVLPPVVREVILCADADAKDKVSAEILLQNAVRAHAAMGRVVRIARPDPGKDFNDMLDQS